MVTKSDSQHYSITNRDITLNTKIKIENILPILAILIACFYPTSSNGIIFGNTGVIWYYLFSSLFIAIVFLINKSNKKIIFITITLIVYLEIVTLISSLATGATFSIARFAPIFLCLLTFAIKVNYSGSFKVLRAALEIITLIIIIWNLGIVLQMPFILDFTVNNYSQFNYFTVSFGISIGKPFFTFGVHTFASFYYMLLFYLWYLTIKNDSNRKRRYYLYLPALLINTILLKSSAALMFSIIMIILILKVSKNLLFRLYIVTFIIAITGFILQTEIFDIYRTMVTSSSHGVLPRYLAENSIFVGNFAVLKDTILGIGYTIPRDYAITYTDSGYIVYLTMGNIILLVSLYYMLGSFLKTNIKRYSKGIFLIVLMFDLAIPSLIYLKTSLFLIFIIYYLNSLDENNKRRTTE
jgi:hypothetical protein